MKRSEAVQKTSTICLILAGVSFLLSYIFPLLIWMSAGLIFGVILILIFDYYDW